MKILVVDDERLLVKGIKFNLENEGYQVECAYDGAAAVELAQADFTNLVQTLGMVDPFGRAESVTRAYISSCDFAFQQVITGAASYTEAIRQAPETWRRRESGSSIMTAGSTPPWRPPCAGTSWAAWG